MIHILHLLVGGLLVSSSISFLAAGVLHQFVTELMICGDDTLYDYIIKTGINFGKASYCYFCSFYLFVCLFAFLESVLYFFAYIIVFINLRSRLGTGSPFTFTFLHILGFICISFRLT